MCELNLTYQLSFLDPWFVDWGSAAHHACRLGLPAWKITFITPPTKNEENCISLKLTIETSVNGLVRLCSENTRENKCRCIYRFL